MLYLLQGLNIALLLALGGWATHCQRQRDSAHDWIDEIITELSSKYTEENHARIEELVDRVADLGIDRPIHPGGGS